MTITSRHISRVLVATLAIVFFSLPSHAEGFDATLFGGIQHPGKLTFETAPGSASNLVKNFNPKTFGVFGIRLGHGKVIGGEHTLEYSPNFIDSDSKAVIYHSNLRIQAPLPVFKPYATAGIGMVHSGGNSLSSFGTKFAFNYGGGLSIAGGPIGVNMDLRGYAVPQIKVVGFTGQKRMDFIQATAGINFRF